MAGSVLLSNMYGSVTLSEDGALCCECRGRVVTALILLGASVFAGGLVAAAILGGGRLPLRSYGSGLVMVLGLTALAFARRRRHGFFVFSPETGRLVRGRGGPQASYTIAEVRGPRLVRDLTDGMSRSPHWLVVDVDDRSFRLAKGSPAQLQPVADALAAVGVRGSARG